MTHSLIRWPLRVLLAFLAAFGIMPAPLHVEWLRWLASDMGATHPDLPEVLSEIAQLRGCRG